MDRQLDAEGAQRLGAFLENSGIAVLTEARLAQFEIDGAHVRAMHLEDGRRVEGEIFVACAGVKPDVALAREAGLAVGRGIKVDARMATDDPAIFAVGDVAEPPLPGPAGLWPVAVQQGRIAAEALLEAAAPAGAAAASPPSTETARIVLQLKSDGIDLRSFGEFDATPEGAEVLCADPVDVAWWRLVVHDGRAIGAVYVGPPGTAQALTRALQVGSDLTPCLPALRQRRLDLSALSARAA